MPAKNIFRVKNEGVTLHIYNEGVEQKAIFPEKEDRETFVEYLNEYLAPKNDKEIKKSFVVNGKVYLGKTRTPQNYHRKVELLCYSIQPTHFHIIVEQITANSVERFVRSLCTRYSIYFNKKYARVGSLFRGPYKSIQIENLSDLCLLSKYLNSSDPNISKNSLAEYTGQRFTVWVNPKKVLDSISEDTKEAYSKYASEVKQGFSHLEKERLKIISLRKNDSKFNPEKTKDETKTSGFAVNQENFAGNLKSQTFISKTNVASNFTELSTLKRIPELFFATILFIALFSIGMQNIRAQEYKKLESNKATNKEIIQIVQDKDFSPTPSDREKIEKLADINLINQENKDVLGNMAEKENQNIKEYEELSISQHDFLSNRYHLEKNTKKVVILKSDDTTPIIYIYKYPSTESDIIGIAIEGDRYDYISTIGQWQEIRFNITTIGFVLAKNTNIEEIYLD